jgi:hypothetical protein
MITRDYYDEYCPTCSNKMELRMVGLKSYIFFCHRCQEHHIIKISEKGDDKDEATNYNRRSS